MELSTGLARYRKMYLEQVAEIECIRGELKLARQGAKFCFQNAKDADSNAVEVELHEIADKIRKGEF